MSSSYFHDRANGPRTRDFPTWNDTALFHEDLQCHVHGVRHWPDRELIRVYVAKGDCTDFTGTMYCCLLDNESCVVPVRRIEVFAGSKFDTVYMIDANGEWQAYRPDRLPEALDNGDVYELPWTHEEQTPATWLPKMPCDRRPGTAPSNEREAAKAGAANQLNEYIDRKVRALNITRADALRKLDAEIDALLGSNQ